MLLPAMSLAGGLKGKVTTSKEFMEAFIEGADGSGQQKVDFYWQVENGVLPIMPPPLDIDERVGIALFRKDGKVASGFLPEHPEIHGASIVPRTIVAPPKTTLKFHNTDPFVHELYSEDLGKLFEPELQSTQQTRQVQFNNPGLYVIQCAMTPHLEGYVVIVPGVVAFANPADDGSFLFEDLEPGDYVVKFYFDGQEIASQEATVVESEKEKDYAEVEVELPAPPESGSGDAQTDEKAGGSESGDEKEKGEGK